MDQCKPQFLGDSGKELSDKLVRLTEQVEVIADPSLHPFLAMEPELFMESVSKHSGFKVYKT